MKNLKLPEAMLYKRSKYTIRVISYNCFKKTGSDRRPAEVWSWSGSTRVESISHFSLRIAFAANQRKPSSPKFFRKIALYRKFKTNIPRIETARKSGMRQFHFWEYINQILLAVCLESCRNMFCYTLCKAFFLCNRPLLNIDNFFCKACEKIKK
jgi:hypothetical protein